MENYTALEELFPGFLVKQECHQPGGSHKVRAARWVVQKAVERGDILPGETTLIEKTGGNFGFGLLCAARPYQLPVELAVGLSFSPLKRQYLERFGATLIGIEQLKAGKTPKEVVFWHLEQASELGKNYFYTDQFNNQDCVLAHEQETGSEIATQLKAWPDVENLIFVTSAGTGAHLTGITRALKRAGYGVQTILMEPEGCDSRAGIFVDHPFEGIAVGVSPPLLDWSLVNEVHWVTPDEMHNTKTTFAQKTGYLIGNTSAGCMAVALNLLGRTNERTKVLTLAYDHGLWYNA